MNISLLPVDGTGYDLHKALPKGKGYGSLYRPERDIPLLRVSGL